jgi:hypothetical protein
MKGVGIQLPKNALRKLQTRIPVDNRDYHHVLGECLINAVVSMGRRNTQLEPTLH